MDSLIEGRVKRLGLAALIVAGLVFGIESILALLRQRNIDVAIQVRAAQETAATPETASGVATPPATGMAGTQTLRPDGSVQVRVHWDYRIGPRFPQTVVQAQALDQSGQVVSSSQYTVDCGIEPLQCNGTVSLPLDYGVKDKTGTKAPWPAGDYLVQVTRTYVGFKPMLLASQPLKVLPQQ